MNEIWKDIKGYEGAYQISNLGSVKSLKHRGLIRDKILKPAFVRGYLCVSLCVNGTKFRKTHKVHRLVAQTFLDNPENKPTVNHKDGDKANNSVTNLEWATMLENNIHAISTKLRVMPKGDKCHMYGNKINAKLVLDTSTGIFYDSAKEAAECFGIKHSSMKSMLNGSFKNRTNLIYA